jgi:purine nucleoside phosphorylase
MTFLAEHRSIDVHHNRLMQDYAATMLHRPADVEEVAYCMEVTGELYAQMVGGAFRRADQERTSASGELAA